MNVSSKAKDVDHGKTTLTKALSGKWTDTHSEELKRGITIRLGYADASFYKTKEGKYTTDANGNTLLRKVSFIDAPGHESLMATMLSGAAIIDGALLLVAANEKCPQPQTREHLMALEIIGVKHIIIVQNKIDLVSSEEAMQNYKDIKNFVKGTIAENAPIVPISAQHNVNIDSLIEAIEATIKTPKRDDTKEALFFVARSFDINKPGSEIEILNGGVLGGSLKQGILKKGEEIEIRPGFRREKENKVICEPLITKIVSIMSGGELLDELRPGGSAALLTSLDPSYVKSDTLIGNVSGKKGKVPEIYDKLRLEIKLLERVVGSKEDLKVDPIRKGEILMLNVNSAATVGFVEEIKKNVAEIRLKLAVCANKTDRFTVSRNLGSRWRLIGFGKMV
ncbi:translation initiation factor IF-2 subunit gamma [Candidatus Woesearchaeota archaeon]|nr:translation initiation factor IF-2 subunit gamma [Candidatus Woesearchaeota archaeon]